MLLALLISIIIAVCAVVVVRTVGPFLEVPAPIIKVVCMIIGVAWLCYALILFWPFLSNPAHFGDH